MIHFGNTSIRILSEQTVKLSCDMCFTFEHSGSETIVFGTPVYWDKAIQSILGSTYTMFEIYEKELPHNACNRITDYKQVWGLLDLPKGDLSARVDCGGKNVYLGLSKSNLQQLTESSANSYLLIPSKYNENLELIWKYFLESYSNPQHNNLIERFFFVVGEYPYVVMLHYSYVEEASLIVVCNSSDSFRKKLEAFPNPNVIVPHFRRLLQ